MMTEVLEMLTVTIGASLEISIHRPGATLTKIWGKYLLFLYCTVQNLKKKPPGAKSWEPGSNGAGEPGYFEACIGVTILKS